MPLTSAEILGIALHKGIAILDCESYKEAVSMASALRHWVKYNDKQDRYEITRKGNTVTAKRIGKKESHA